MAHEYDFTTELWLWPGDAAWHFITVPFDETDEIDEVTTGTQRGFGSVRVEVTVGTMTWRTSLFPSKEKEAFVLPIKKQVRVSQNLVVGAPVRVQLRLLDVSG